MFGVSACRQIPAQAHRNRPGGDLGQPRRDDDAARVHGPGQARRQGERDGEAVGHADDDVPDDFGGGEVLLDVRRLGHGAPWSGRAMLLLYPAQ